MINSSRPEMVIKLVYSRFWAVFTKEINMNNLDEVYFLLNKPHRYEDYIASLCPFLLLIADRVFSFMKSIIIVQRAERKEKLAIS